MLPVEPPRTIETARLRLRAPVAADVAAKGLPIKLRVLTINPARELYERLGFSVVRSTAEHHYMEYR